MCRASAGKLKHGVRDLFATLHGGLDRVCEIFIICADQTKINKRDMTRERLARDRVVEHTERGGRDAAQMRIRKTRIIDCADSGRELSVQHEIEHAAITGAELLTHIGKLRHDFSNRVCLFLEKSSLSQRIVSTCADDEVGCIIWDAIELRIDPPSPGPPPGVERAPPTLRQNLAELDQHVGPSRDVSSVIENGIAKQHNMGHRDLSTGTSLRNPCA